MRDLIRQGDVLLIPTADAIPENGKLDASGILAAGEVTGHHHRVRKEDKHAAKLYRVASWGNQPSAYLQVGEQSISITHEEHAPVSVPPGRYAVRIMREFDAVEEIARQVRD